MFLYINSSALIQVFVWFSTLIFPFYKMLFLKKLEISLYEFFNQEYGFLQNLPVEGTVICLEQKTRVFCHIDVQ